MVRLVDGSDSKFFSAKTFQELGASEDVIQALTSIGKGRGSGQDMP